MGGQWKHVVEPTPGNLQTKEWIYAHAQRSRHINKENFPSVVSWENFGKILSTLHKCTIFVASETSTSQVTHYSDESQVWECHTQV